jgi:hypothetical protein
MSSSTYGALLAPTPAQAAAAASSEQSPKVKEIETKLANASNGQLEKYGYTRQGGKIVNKAAASSGSTVTDLEKGAQALLDPVGFGLEQAGLPNPAGDLNPLDLFGTLGGAVGGKVNSAVNSVAGGVAEEVVKDAVGAVEPIAVSVLLHVVFLVGAVGLIGYGALTMVRPSPPSIGGVVKKAAVGAMAL